MKHKEFILTPLSSLIEQTLRPLDLYKGQMCNYIMKEYVLQTLFMKLTGCMEQKAKCILWDIATHDFEYRGNFLRDNSRQGEYSTYKSKNYVYKVLVEHVGKIDDQRKGELLTQLEDFKNKILEESILKVWLPRELRDLKIKELFAIKRWAGDSLLGNPLNDEEYKSLYIHRNRCAHNVLSYQGNAMNPQKIKEVGDASYATWFTLLVLMDMIYMEQYEKVHNQIKLISL
ncbi:hypothetical protein [Alloprevotella sp. oral taxon 473]|uniref:hypothetical protein n=1 Tax=Alloprevotella sp. oral taxon 473 TaxID=712469 RepID=UPI0002A44AA4|nr:hypothetical protein [Alloprevotella sp. oral taxon 473]EKX92968.1 hypothetical protein HMPREF9999_00506 [Alloprevotella sp. oral taxon 473 str. F0040]